MDKEEKANTNRGQKATLAASQPQFDAKEAIQNALILEPDLPSNQLAERLAKEAAKHRDFIHRISYTYFFRSLSAARKKDARAKHEQYQLPGLEHLPVRIRGTKNKQVDLLDATYFGVREWVKGINARKRNDPLMQEAKALVEKMHEASKQQRGITVRRAYESETRSAPGGKTK